MQAIQAPINPGDTGSQVANLQAVMGLLAKDPDGIVPDTGNPPSREELEILAVKLESERAEQIFGDVTEALVTFFRQQRGLDGPVMGWVDERTASALNDWLRAKGLLGDVPLVYEVSGIVSDVARDRVRLVRVVALRAADPAPEQRLGEDITNGKGFYSIRFSADSWVRTPADPAAPELLVRVYGEEGVEIGVSARITEIKEIMQLDVVVTPDRWIVEGVVRRGAVPVKDALVDVFDRDLRKRQRLGSAVTDANGRYRVDYRTSDFQFGDRKIRPTPWLIVQARADEESSLVTVERSSSVGRHQTIDLALAENIPSEWEQATASVMPLLVGQVDGPEGTVDLPPHAIEERDFEFLIRETGLGADVLRAWVLSHGVRKDALTRLGDDHAAQRAAFEADGWPFAYGIVRQALAANLDEVLRLAAPTWEQAWTAARSLNRVPLLESERLALVVQALELLQSLQQLDPVQGDAGGLARVLAQSPVTLPAVVALDALAIYRDKGLDDPDAFLALQESHPGSSGAIKTFVRTARVHRLVSGNEALLTALTARLEGDSDSIAPLAALPASEWMSLAGEVSVSPGLSLAVQASAELLHPLTALRARVVDGAVDLPGATKAEIAALIESQGPMVESIVQGLAPVRDQDDPPAAHSALRDLGRFVRTGINVELAGHLMRAAVPTPAAAIRLGRDVVQGHVAGAVPPAVAAEVVGSFFDYAEPVLNGGNGFLIDVSVSGSGPAWFMDGQDVTVPESVRPKLPSFPGLFGDLDECACKPCESMLSQSAYLVDLLNLLQQCPTEVRGKTAYHVLATRRPDIPQLDLSCASEREIQHIDLVLDILEREVGALPYRQTASACFPWSLPFFRSRVEIQAYLAKLGLARLDLLLHRSATAPSQLAAEVLDLSFPQTANQGGGSDWELVAHQRRDDALWSAYGLSPDRDGNITIDDPASGESTGEMYVGDILSRASVLLDRTGLELDDLDKVLATQFVGSVSFSQRHQCKTSRMHLPVEGSQLQGILDRLPRFVRLHARLSGWSIAQLDRALAACDAIETETTTDADREAALIKLAFLRRVQYRYGLPFEVLLTQPESADALRKTLALSDPQFAMLKALTGIDPASSAFDAASLERLCAVLSHLREAGLTVEQAASALLPRSILSGLGQERSASLKSAEQIETLLKALQQRLRAVGAEPLGVTKESQAAESLTAIFNAETAAAVVQAILSAGATGAVDREPDPALLTILCGTGGATHTLGDWSPLLSASHAEEILGVSATNKADAESRFALLLAEVANRRRERELVTVISEQCGLTEPEVAALLGRRLLLDRAPAKPGRAFETLLDKGFWAGDTPPDVSPSVQPRLYPWMDRLYRLTALIPALGLDSELMQLADRIVVGNTAGIDWREILATTAAAAGAGWQALLDLIWLQRPECLSRAVVLDLMDALEARGAEAPLAGTVRPLAIRLGLDETETLAIVGQATSVSDARQLLDPTWLRRAFELLLLARKLGANKVQLQQLADPTDNDTASSTALLLLKTVIGAEAWTESAKPIEDRLRQQRRDALVAFLVQTQHLTDANDLYERYLIDPKIEPCLWTTPMLEAITATQLFAQRILFGLEHQVTAGAALKGRWTWMRNYRVWEANRKVFLFPENWLYPELRDDKSSSFILLESALGQCELTQDLAREAFGLFLDDVAQMGQVQVLGMYEDVVRDIDDVPLHRVLYVISRTINPPYKYFWRRCDDFGTDHAEWQPWRRIELDVQGDHVLIFLIGADLYIAWPRFKYLQKKEREAFRWDITLAWSRHNGKNWSRIETSRDSQVITAQPFQDERDAFTFRCSAGDRNALIACYVRSSISGLSIDPPTDPPKSRLEQWNTFLYNEFRTTCYRWDSVCQLAQDSKYYYSQPDPDTVIEAGLIVRWECWVKAKDENGTEGYVMLDPRPSASYQATLRNPLIVSVPLGKACVVWAKVTAGTAIPVIPKISFTVELTIDPNGAKRTASSNTLVVDETPMLFLRTVYAKFVIDPANGEIPTLEQLGVEMPKTFAPANVFVLHDTGHVNIVAPNDPSKGPVVLDECRSYMNGLAEDGAGRPLRLAGGSRTTALEPFREPYNAAERYWAVGAASKRSMDVAPDVWFYSEGLGACFIDSHRPGGKRLSFSAFAASYVEATEYRLAWSRDTMLLGGAYPTGAFGAGHLPALSSDPAGLWAKQRNGELAFDSRLPYACYNWEVFFHAPLLIADQLSKQHRFEDAERWLRFVFDPTSGETGSDAKGFLKFRVFRELNLRKQVVDDLTALAQAAAGVATEADLAAIEKLIDRWRDAPFRPFLIARRRHIAFLWRTLFAYLDNLIAWADSLYRRDTRESLNEATLLYVLAERILGRRPRRHTAGAQRAAVKYSDLVDRWDKFGNFWIDVATIRKGWRRNRSKSDDIRPQPSPDGRLYFCMPYNDKIDSYWNTVDNRLTNLRHCRNIEGIERSLPLTDAPIDPELLVRATAAGLDLGDVIAGLYAPPPHYRYGTLATRALDLASEARALGAAMLSAIEKGDAERLAQLRSTNEVALLTLVHHVRTLQVAEGERNLEALRASRRTVGARYAQYQRLLGNKDIKIPGEQQSAGEEAMLGTIDSGLSSNRSNLGLIKEENEQYVGFEGAGTWSVAAGIAKVVSGAAHVTASIMAPIPYDAVTKASIVAKYAGDSAAIIGDGFSTVSQAWKNYAEQQGMMATHLRRRDEWAFQSNQALSELQHIDRQILANEIRVTITQKELDNQIEQIEQVKAVDEVLRSKFSNAQLYQWMLSQLSGLHFSAYRMALEMARRAERAAARELGVSALNILRNDYWDSLRNGLLAGERLVQDIKRLETAYLEQNRRELEITRHFSLRQLDPAALLALRATGSCKFKLSEWLFDLDFPGHYFRRIKTVSVSLPCVVGPYTSVSGTLTLLTSQIREKPARTASGEDPNKTSSYLPIQSIATSSAQNDGGMFELNFRDERYLPFEGSGAESTWAFRLPEEFRAFDYETINDLVMHLRYTARDGGKTLRDAATKVIGQDGEFIQLLSLKHDFATELAARNANSTTLTLRLGADLRPYICRTGFKLKDAQVDLWKKGAGGPTKHPVSVIDGLDTVTLPVADVDLTLDPHLMLHYVKQVAVP